ncbi:MAG: hypothetical protein HC780_21335 [Leptolyngbyaceae cyanobacterium CSU_1_3]|nr:hypothetical protein [Leptolyngbyaceae cyanobacterium CSU_1_3]
MHNLVSLKIDPPQGEPMTLRSLSDTHHGIGSGRAVRISIPPEEVHWFDATTGDRWVTDSAQVLAG